MAQIQGQEEMKKMPTPPIYDTRKQAEKLVSFVENKYNTKIEKAYNKEIIVDEKNIFENDYFDIIDELDGIELKLNISKVINFVFKKLNINNKCFNCFKRKFKKIRNKMMKEMENVASKEEIEDFIDMLIKLAKRKNKKTFWEMGRENPVLMKEFLNRVCKIEI